MSTTIAKTAESNVSVGFTNVQSFEFSQRAAQALAASTLVPEQFRRMVVDKKSKNPVENPNAVPNCIIALNMSDRLKADVLMVMQNLFLVEGRPSWSAQFVIASINSCGRFSPLRFDLSAPGDEREVEYTTVKWVDGQRQTIKTKCTVRDRTCRAWAIEKATGDRLDGPEVSIAMAEAEGWLGKNGSKWQTMPEVMLRYRAASFFGKLYAPELLMGLQTVEEASEVIDVTPVDLSAVSAAAAPARPTRSDFAATSAVVDVAQEQDPFTFQNIDGEVLEIDYPQAFVAQLVTALEAAGTRMEIEGIWESNSGQLTRIRAEAEDDAKLADEAHDAYALALDRVHVNGGGAQDTKATGQSNVAEDMAIAIDALIEEINAAASAPDAEEITAANKELLGRAYKDARPAYKRFLEAYNAKTGKA